jgi:hypothetical protein
VHRNPLDSTAAIKFKKQATTTEEDGEVVKSLFELHKDSNFKPLEDFKASISSAEKKPVFKFSTNLPVLKPFFPA